MPFVAGAGGTWTPLTTAPPSGLQYGLLLSDGTVICANGGTGWYRLTPNIHGSYANGTWTQIASMNYSRLFFSSDVLTNGNVYVAGGEYGGGPAELYSTFSNTWTVIQPPSENFSDACSKILPNGNVLQSDSQSGYAIYNAAANIMTGGGSCEDMNESCWVRMPNDNILAVTGYSTTSEHYVPSLNAWYADGDVPVAVFGYGGELGPAFVLPNGKVFQVGATDNTAIYTPGTTLTSAGSWVAGPQMLFGTNQLGAVDAPGAMMITGNILLCISPDNGFNSPCSFYEYNYVSNNFTQESAPGGGTNNGGDPFGTTMLDLPDGTVLFFGGQGSTSLFVYAPSGAPLAAGQPAISSITQNLNGSYHLTGVGLNGITGGAAYGDDWQMDTSYPLVRLTNTSSGNVYYARTYNWSSTTIQNTNPVTTEFTLPPGLPSGTYSLAVTVMGNASAPVSFTNAPPAAPSGLTGTPGNAQAILSWNAVSGATAYNVERLTTSGTPYYAIVATVTGTSITNVGLVNAYNYSYVVTAVSAGGVSTNSAPLIITPYGPPPVPSGVTAASATFARIYLSWTPSYGAASYTISRSTNLTGTYANLASSVNPFYTDSGLLNGATYYYEVSAVSAEGTSGNSVAVSAIAQAIANFGFEVPNIGSGNDVYGPTNGFWNFNDTNGGGAGIIANGSPFSNPNAPEGVQAAFVQSNGVISQVFAGFTPGSTYTISYFAAQRPGNAQTWNVTIDGTVIASYAPGSGATSYSNYTATFTAAATTETLAFAGTDTAGGDNTIFIDDVQIVAGSFVNVPNFGFETPSIGNYSYDPAGGSWTFAGTSPSGSGIVDNGSGFSNPNAPQGVQAAFVQEHGTITQAISGLAPGKLYQITFEAAQRGAPNQNGGESWNVTMGGTTIASYNPGPGATTYVNYTANFTATAATETLAFAGTDLATGDNTVFLDDVTLAQPLQPVSPVVTLSNPTNGGVYSTTTPINLTATVATNGNSISSVGFYDEETNLIAEVDNPPYNYAWTSPNTGSYAVFAQATYNGGSVADSSAANITILSINTNFGFETPSIGTGNYQYDPSGASWTFSGSPGSGSGIIANGSGFSNPNAPQGVQAAFVQGYGTITQTLSGFTPGTEYKITFEACQRPDSGSVNNSGQSWNVTIDGTVIASYNPGESATTYATYTATFTATAAVETLAFVGTDLAGGDNTVFIDNITIAGVYETPSFSNLTASQTTTYGATAITLAGKVSATGPVYPASGETVKVTIDGNLQTTTINDSTGDFSFSYNPHTIPASGTAYTITYTYGGDVLLNPATNTSTTLKVNQAALTVTASAQSKTYGQTLTFGSGSTLFTSSGLMNGETIGSVTLAVSGSPSGGTTNAAVGTYTITPSAATGGTFNLANYAITYNTGTLTVTKATPGFSNLTASQTASCGASAITLAGKVSAAGPVYPATGETVGVTINGNLQTTTINDSTGDFSINYNPQTIPARGTAYTITYSYGGDASFNSASNTSTALTVNKATPSFSNLTPSQTASCGASAITLAGKVSAAGPVYPASGETVGVTINGNLQTTTIDDSTGDFSFSYNPSTILTNATAYPITYSYAGDASLNSASDASTTLTIGPPQLTIFLSGASVILTWPAIATGYTLQSSTNLFPAAWSVVSPNPVVVNGLNTVTNSISGTQQFYELSQ